MMRIKNMAIVLTGILTLGGCKSEEVVSNMTTGTISSSNSPSNLGHYYSVSPHQALAGFYGGQPAMTGVRQRLYKNGLKQKIVLTNETTYQGQNSIELIYNQRANRNIDDSIAIHANDLHSMNSAFNKQFPGKAFKPSNNIFKNRYGIYGLSMVQIDKKTACLFAWQRMHISASIPQTTKRHRGKDEQENLSYRMRYCAPGLDQLKSERIMNSIVIHNAHGGTVANTVGQQNTYPNYVATYNQPAQPGLYSTAINTPPTYGRVSAKPTIKPKSRPAKQRTKRITKSSYSSFPTVPLPE